jgi:hypothetical protein
LRKFDDHSLVIHGQQTDKGLRCGFNGRNLALQACGVIEKRGN